MKPSPDTLCLLFIPSFALLEIRAIELPFAVKFRVLSLLSPSFFIALTLFLLLLRPENKRPFLFLLLLFLFVFFFFLLFTQEGKTFGYILSLLRKFALEEIQLEVVIDVDTHFFSSFFVVVFR